MKRLNAKTVLLLIAFVMAGCNSYGSKSQSRNSARHRQSFASAAPSSTSSAKPNASVPQSKDSTSQGKDSAQQCDPNYSPCVPIASDVDCAGGRGNGPAYVKGPVRVIGRDIYGLDRDHDGIGCER